ncbi:solute carrier family 25 member 34-like [Pectinophora gossypiella]|uniref:solute carrier family 25 member 34-like n=1 Tax=Pectinophora gossypiella TaxID=13191 RepID=UPI00214F054B|nr:solute carrier family 25 member 34-like [Pectinophora gossypiella]XP_049867611.1 solute carrier family 25 member 34-like [Pectinophora gossypiella]XP_049867612.1 solute carrier family 25 member 34-like [Pectinophora gossypiella]
MDRSSYFQQYSKFWTTFLASNMAALAESATTTPIDNVARRLSREQPVDLKCKGKRIILRGLSQCARTIAVTEGLNAFYRGFLPNYLRQAPQSVLLLVFWDALIDINDSYIVQG